MWRHAWLGLCLLVVSSLAVGQEVTNLVRNPGFEQVAGERPDRWTLTGAAGLDNAQFYAGAMGLVMHHKALATATATQTVQCGEREYLALVWVRLEQVAGMGARVRLLGPTGQVLAASQPLTGDSPWRRIAVPFNPGNVGQVTVELSLTQATGAVWFDDVLVAEATQAKALLEPVQQGPRRENLALNKPYELSPPPNYEHCTDPEDTIQLTDGQYTVGYFWTQKSTVGWYTHSPQITIDLGRVEPIAGIMINIPGGGAAGVKFPVELTYLVSDDNVQFHPVASLTPKGLKQDGRSWYAHKFLADDLATRGRYVMIRLTAGSSTVFADEIEVYKGDHDPAAVKFTAPPRSRLEMAFGQYSLTPTTYTYGHFPETPHVKWARPLAGGPVKAIVLCFSNDMRDVCELAQRVDLDYVPVSHFSYYHANPLGNLMQEQIETALPTAQVMIVGGYRWEATPPALLEKIKARVREGMGLVVVSSAAPFNKAIEDVLQAGPLEGDQGLLDQVPINLLPGYRRPGKSHYSLGQYGQGRVALVDPGRFTRQAHSLLPMWWLEALDDDANTPLEYYWAALSKVILWAAGSAAGKLTHLAATPESLRVQVAPLAQPATLQIIIRDAFFDPVVTETRAVTAAGGTFELPTPPGTNGVHPVDVWLRDAADKILDFGSMSYVTDNGSRLESLTLDKPVYAPRETVRLTVKVGGELAGLGVQTELVDIHGRHLLPPRTVPLSGPEMTLPLAVTEPVTLGANLFVTLRQGERVLERKLERVWFDLHPADDYTFMAWYSWDYQPASYHGSALLRSVGLDGYVSLPGIWRAQNAAYSNLRHGPENVTRVAPENKDDSRVRVPCLTDPQFRAKTAERIEKMAQEVRPYGVTEWSLGDESTLGRRDYCISPTCLAAFRDYLRQQYPSLESLNEAWGSQFAAWDQVMPATLAEVEKKPRLGAWLDHRRYMESLFAEYHDWGKGLITKHIPEARVGISGTPNVNSYSGHDWWKLMQGPLTHLSSYGGVQREMQRSFARPGTFVSCFLGYDYKDNDEQRARYSPWDLAFRGSNGINYYTLVSDTLNCPLIRPDMTLTNKAPWFFEEVKELKSGLGRLLMSAKYANDGIAVHYSPASVHAATALGLFDNRDRLRRYDNNLSNLSMMLTQLHLQYNFVHEEQMARGELSRYKVLLLPWSSAISLREAAAIRAFVQQGGTVIADSYCGVRDDHGAPRAMLDDLFGIKQSLALPQLQAAEMKRGGGGTAGAPAVVPVASGSPELQLAGGQATYRVGEMPAVIVNPVGRGRAIFLNGSFSNYAEVTESGFAGETLEQEVAPETVTAPIRQFISSLLQAAGVQAPVRVTSPGNQEATVEVARLGLEQADLVGVVRGITAGAVNPRDLLDCRLSWPQARHVYDSRAGQYLGEVKEIQARLPRGVAKVYALLNYPVRGVSVSGPARVQTGRPLVVKLAVSSTRPGVKLGTHVLQVTLTGPEGQQRPWYATNVVAPGGQATVTVPLAYNDPPGNWTVTARDVATGTTGRYQVNVAR
jgi:hypothetical protein